MVETRTWWCLGESVEWERRVRGLWHHMRSCDGQGGKSMGELLPEHRQSKGFWEAVVSNSRCCRGIGGRNRNHWAIPASLLHCGGVRYSHRHDVNEDVQVQAERLGRAPNPDLERSLLKVTPHWAGNYQAAGNWEFFGKGAGREQHLLRPRGVESTGRPGKLKNWINEAKVTYFSVFWWGEPEDVGKMTAENKIVVDRRDLIPKVLTLNVGDEFCGVVSHIQTPGDFFCQKLQSGCK